MNFTAYTKLRTILQDYQSSPPTKNSTVSPTDKVTVRPDLPSYQTMTIGLISGAMGPLSNAPIDTIKTRLQKTPAMPDETAVSRVVRIGRDMWKQEGSRSFYKGITPRIMRVAPGQAVTFTVYEYLRGLLERSKVVMPDGRRFEEWLLQVGQPVLYVLNGENGGDYTGVLFVSLKPLIHTCWYFKVYSMNTDICNSLIL